jgi:predicted phage terminase large subunit-like protein
MSHLFFFVIYLGRYASKFPTAPFQHEIFRLTQEQATKMCVIVAFRDSAKSTICTTSFPLWSILTSQTKFVIIASQTRAQARQHLGNIREEVENNDLLKNDLGPFQSDRDEWGAYSLVFPKYGAKIIAVSSEQSVRGLRYKNYRPDLMIADDLEDLDSTRTQESRDKTYRWFKGELLPAGTRDTRVFVVGNLLHQDSLIVRLQKDIGSGAMPGQFRSYPIIDMEGHSAWPGKYPTPESVDEERRKINDIITWEREYMLRIVAPDDQVIRREWIQTYDRLPKSGFLGVYVGVDLATKDNAWNDCTALVAGRLYNVDDRKILYIEKIINRRMQFPEVIQTIKLLEREYRSTGEWPSFYIEEDGMQAAWTQQLKDQGVNAEGVKTAGSTKRTRLSITAHWVKSGQILFPKTGVNLLVEQLIGFGVEKHDDLADAFGYLSIKTLTAPLPDEPEIWVLKF